eukprot:m.292198 g.292198  ORF g.292198 m.292198 type:complete len:54 (-) comp19995_c1_seq4:74-235(-)
MPKATIAPHFEATHVKGVIVTTSGANKPERVLSPTCFYSAWYLDATHSAVRCL